MVYALSELMSECATSTDYNRIGLLQGFQRLVGWTPRLEVGACLNIFAGDEHAEGEPICGEG